MLGGVNRKELARYIAISQVGLLMAVPPGIGVLLDRWLDWSPWGVIVGAVLGLTIGFLQLIRLVNRSENGNPGKSNESDKT
jgi:F0F1-type ATP synthase assembly protein I